MQCICARVVAIERIATESACIHLSAHNVVQPSRERTALSSLALARRRGGKARFAWLCREREREREAKSRGEGWRDMRLSRNRGNARGPTRLTNPLHVVQRLAERTRFTRSLARPSCHQTLPCRIFFLPLLTPERERERERNALLLSSTFRHSTHILLLP